jgi:antibiotic biosynthesis monooxygenase (ABM) superfamily enzyme
MNRSKKIFLIISACFVALMLYFTIDIFSRTSRPGKRRPAVEQPATRPDTLRRDSI